MTDKEIMLELFKKLKLFDAKPDQYGIFSDQIRVESNKVTLGSGDGYFDCYVVFEFDEHGNLLSHGVWE